MSYQTIFFDLDGTLTDPGVGITKSVAYALDKMGISVADLQSLNKFIGPPLKESFMKFYGFNEVDANQCVAYYREYFKEKGIYENEIYDGVPELLQSLKMAGKVLAVATSKPTVFAEIIIKYFHIEAFFTHVVGSNLDGTRTDKSEVIQAALDLVGIEDPASVIMIGDREHDIIGAKKNHLDAIGVLYGYGSYEELSDAGAKDIVKDVAGLKRMLIEG